MSRVGKVVKWMTSAIRVSKVRLAGGKGLRIAYGKPLYLGKGSKIVLGDDAECCLGEGVYLSPGCRLEVMNGARLRIADDVYMNEYCRVVAAEDIRIDGGTILGPNVQVYDHDHDFTKEGVGLELRSAPVHIGSKCWLCANVVITRGCLIAARVLVAANSVVTCDLSDDGAMYAGSPARLIKEFD